MIALYTDSHIAPTPLIIL